jgi:hypothetical protein
MTSVRESVLALPNLLIFVYYHQILISILIGWILSAIFTETNVIPEDKNSEQYGARTDSRTDVIL